MIVFKKVTKTYSSDHIAVKELSFEVEKGEILVLLGRSGSGKTSALRLINRLIEPTSGIIFCDGENIQHLNPISLRRKIGYAIQHIGLFSHMTVEENIGIVPHLLGMSKKGIAKRVEELLNMVGLEPHVFRHLFPSKLSGGQKQRVGVARALAADPPVILMDEPFGALDPLMREQLQNEFLQIQSEIRKTIVFVTHDLSEAVKMGDRIAVLEQGRLVQIATPQQLIEEPATDFIDTFLGKDRFQLLLQTKSLQDLIEKLVQKQETQTSPAIALKTSLMEALTTFKLTNAESLSVFEGKKYIGDLSKQQLMETLITNL